MNLRYTIKKLARIIMRARAPFLIVVSNATINRRPRVDAGTYRYKCRPNIFGGRTRAAAAATAAAAAAAATIAVAAKGGEGATKLRGLLGQCRLERVKLVEHEQARHVFERGFGAHEAKQVERVVHASGCEWRVGWRRRRR